MGELSGRLSSDQVVRIGDSWRELGSEYSEGDVGYLVTAWGKGATERSIREVLAATAPGWRLEAVATVRTRSRWIRERVDFHLDRRTLQDIEREMAEFDEDDELYRWADDEDGDLYPW